MKTEMRSEINSPGSSSSKEKDGRPITEELLQNEPAG